MNLTDTQRIIIANTLQDVLQEAMYTLQLRLKTQAVPCLTSEQAINYNEFARKYMSSLRIEAPASHELVTFTHKHA